MSNNNNYRKSTRIKTGPLPLIIAILLVVLIISSVFAGRSNFAFEKSNYISNGEYNAFWDGVDKLDNVYPNAQTESETMPLPFQYEEYFGPVQYSKKAYFMRDDGVVFLNVGGNDSVYPASLTKIMTAVICVENLPDLDTKITVDEDIITQCIVENASVAGYKAGESVSARDMIYGILLPSGADCCLALAKYISGSEQEFVKLMNLKAEELGLKDTLFQNCTGLHNVKHYSTARDLAFLMKYALSNEFIRKVMSTIAIASMTGSEHPDGLWLVSSVKRAFNKANLGMGNVMGGKTGFTEAAGLCLATFAELTVHGDTQTYILITLGAGDGSQTVAYHAMDAYSVFNTCAFETAAP